MVIVCARLISSPDTPPPRVSGKRHSVGGALSKEMEGPSAEKRSRTEEIRKEFAKLLDLEEIRKEFAKLLDLDDPAEATRLAAQLYYSNEEALKPIRSKHTEPSLLQPDSVDSIDPISFLDGASDELFREDVTPKVKIYSKDIQGDGITSPYWKILKKCEDLIISSSCDDYEVSDVQLEGGTFIHTICVHNTSANDDQGSSIPLVLVHGMCGAIPTFHKNYQLLAAGRSVYGIDLPGFGLSKRVDFPNDPEGCENKMVELIEQWRVKMEINRMILIGHSFGGYISTAYTLKYHKHVRQLVLLDSWGMFSEKDDSNPGTFGDGKWFVKTIFNSIKLNPFEAFSAFGQTFGKYSLRLFMKESKQKLYGRNCIDYFARLCGIQELTGAKAFMVMSNFTIYYPYKPLKERLLKLLESVQLPVTLLYGTDSKFCKNGHTSNSEIQRMAAPHFVIYIMENVGHHLQAEMPEDMVDYILKHICPKSNAS